VNKRKDEFLECIDALIEHVKINTRMDIRDRIAALSLVDRVVAREKGDDDAERRGSKVREFASSFKTPAGTGEGDRRAGTRDTRDGNDGTDPEESDAGIPTA
jgi:hypothetical protein